MSDLRYAKKQYVSSVGLQAAFVSECSRDPSTKGRAVEYARQRINGLSPLQMGQVLEWIYEAGTGNSGIDKFLPSFDRVQGKAKSY